MGIDQVLYETRETAQRAIIERDSLRSGRANLGHGFDPMMVDVV
jgi:hypothetical protein